MSGLFAQSTDPISGGAGWVGAGLLGLVLAWLLLRHLPEKDRLFMSIVAEFRAEIAAERKATQERDDKFATALKSLSDNLHDAVVWMSRLTNSIQRDESK